MTDKKLLSDLTKLGLPMFEAGDEPDVNNTIAKVVKSNDMRLWEGFPVLLANAAEKYGFSLEQIEKELDNKKQKGLFHNLVLLAGALFNHYHLSFPWWSRFKKDLSIEDKDRVRVWRTCLTNDQSLKLKNVEFDSIRLKKMFDLYFEEKVEKDRRQKEKYEELSLEYALSQVFPPKQKELFKKKLDGLPLTKTEQEYYSRRVKKKVVALANSELHSLSKKLVYNS
ncbi:MAG: hypothetical protein JXL81_09720 [Deltaproteobacteria bacterium]|nr:hypothetical protein [Deltaproteobacteria bacterium]